MSLFAKSDNMLDFVTGGAYSQQAKDIVNGIDGKKNKKKPTTPKPTTPAPPPPQWTFHPSPYDQAPYSSATMPGGAPGSASQWTVNPQTQPWMLNPGAQQQPQQPPAPQDPNAPMGYGYYNQWAMNPFAGY